MKSSFLIEAVVDSLEAAILAEAAGADRLELCAALETGGITPGMGLIQGVCDRVNIPVFVLIRTRSGDFTCTDFEFETLLLEAEAAREAGAAGIVAGILLPDGRIDAQRMSLLCQAASPLPVTFHRAFDRARDRDEAIEDLIASGCKRLLSSGMTSSAFEGRHTLRYLNEKLEGKVIVMPGGGINENNVTEIAGLSGASEFHFSAISQVAGKGWVPTPDKVTDIKHALDDWFEEA